MRKQKDINMRKMGKNENMEKDKIARFGILGLAMVVLAALIFSANSAVAQVQNETQTTATVNVNEFISVTLTNAPIDFGNLNPGTTNQNASTTNGFPLTVNIEPETNVVTNLSVKGNDFTGAGGTIGIGNMSFSNSSTVATATQMSTSYQGDAIYSNFDAIPQPGGSAVTRDIYFWISIPAGQQAGIYTSNVFIRVQKDG